MISVASVAQEIRNAQGRLGDLLRLPRKSEVDHQLIADLREYIAGLYENLGELKREEAGRKRGF